MKRDIENKEDIRELIDAFYEKVRNDVVIGPIFNDVVKVDWKHHLPVMYDFWENVLFQTGGYTGNPMVTHMQLHQRHPLSGVHFDQWIRLFTRTVDELFEGRNAEIARQRAMSIARLMQVRLPAH
ncbi:group III truncated hemoglobin [Flavitalea sp. BT771]|uniref:group III truncated hemoglobin n=1 Tax=Flavitalea sp. BT771 TaxID=3063329 RepID=UPI0026E34A2C|nr:group III truncated hemoglobin [Flavitalea sp. BT771]MDO6430566.1 group III truncated hemoglobin [Flavitalea sp. BT771]MDV6219294.1 group III truncated hemoglobin [Flavitalea sp. BT771]